MTLVTYGELMDQGCSAFVAFARVEEGQLSVGFKGEIKVGSQDHYLKEFSGDLAEKLQKNRVKKVFFDFTGLEGCDSNGLRSLIDIAEFIYAHSEGEVYVKRLAADEWQQQTLPTLLHLADELNCRRTILFHDTPGLPA